MGAELWVGKSLYSLDLSKSPATCTVTPINLEILRPNWLQSASYLTTQYLLRQAAGPISNYTLADLYQAPAVIGGEHNSWVVANSSIAEPIRLEGPDIAGSPDLAILEFQTFEAVESFDTSVFAIPSSCHKVHSTVGHLPSFSMARFLAQFAQRNLD